MVEAPGQALATTLAAAPVPLQHAALSGASDVLFESAPSAVLAAALASRCELQPIEPWSHKALYPVVAETMLMLTLPLSLLMPPDAMARVQVSAALAALPHVEAVALVDRGSASSAIENWALLDRLVGLVTLNQANCSCAVDDEAVAHIDRGSWLQRLSLPGCNHINDAGVARHARARCLAHVVRASRPRGQLRRHCAERARPAKLYRRRRRRALAPG